jgi:hypothetical protein
VKAENGFVAHGICFVAAGDTKHQARNISDFSRMEEAATMTGGLVKIE